MGELRGESETHRGGFSVIEHMHLFMQENVSHNSKHTSDQPLLLMLPNFVGDFETRMMELWEAFGRQGTI